jgi:hypothetical protein
MGRDFRSSFTSGFDPGFDSGTLGWSALLFIKGILLGLPSRRFGGLPRVCPEMGREED